MTDDTVPRLRSNLAFMSGAATMSSMRLQADDYVGLGSSLGQVADAVALCLKDAKALGDAERVQAAFDGALSGDGP